MTDADEDHNIVDKKVLRTIYLSLEVDRQLRAIAFTGNKSKSEVMSGFIKDGLRKLEGSSDKTIARRLSELISIANQEPASEVVEKPTPAQIRKSIRPDAIISFIDGKPYKTLNRHLYARGLTPEMYRERYGLPKDYPMVSAIYSERRSQLAKAFGFGQPGQHSASKSNKPDKNKSASSNTKNRKSAAGGI